MQSGRDYIHMKLNYYAIGVGAGVDLGGSMFFGTLFYVSFAILANTQAANLQELYQIVFQSPVFLGVSFLIGATFNIVGGYLSAKIADQAYLTYGALSAIPCIILGAFELANPLGSIFPVWLLILGKISALVFGIYGGWLCKKHLTSN